MILSIDPGCSESAYTLIDDNLKPIEFGKFCNENVKTEARRLLKKHYAEENKPARVVIEMVACYGMAVGKEVFETCLWVGRFAEMAEMNGSVPHFIYRSDEKINLCHSMKATDSNIVQALIDRFAYNVPNRGKGKKKSPGWFYGFHDDIWQSYAVGITYHDLCFKGNV